MPLQYISETHSFASHARDSLLHHMPLAPDVGAETFSTTGLDFATMQLTRPHAFYHLPVEKVGNGSGLESAILLSYRHFVEISGELVAVVSMKSDGINSARLAKVDFSPQMHILALALDQLASHPAVAVGLYEARVFCIRGLYFQTAVWLKSANQDADLIYPIGTEHPWLKKGAVYASSEFFNAITAPAQDRLARIGQLKTANQKYRRKLGILR